MSWRDKRHIPSAEDTKGSLWSWEEVHDKLKDMPVRKHGYSQY